MSHDTCRYMPMIADDDCRWFFKVFELHLSVCSYISLHCFLLVLTWSLVKIETKAVFMLTQKNTLRGIKIWKNFGDGFVNFLLDVNFIFKSTLMCCLCYDRNWLSVIQGVTWFTWGAHLRWLIYRILCVTPCMILAVWNKLVVLKLKVVFPLLSQHTLR